ncbi:MAG: 3-isopropylmalate dehydratase [Alphaproteobacteria bacterium CG_4_10_14_0_2_um_filter_63_37]|nr:MAG: 3-isopropylmalate dehydratase [Proteobacteria bacterium CG1_02_64_396]PJA24263.1 MAG: 3-isopropylmalate dehydratase [Alphaproteobacteria bacterium CG_4_10_14_0_2_um_filter_63_37]
MSMTITEKILARHAGRDRVVPGENVWIDVDTLMTHDVCGPGTIGIFKREFGADAKVWNKDGLVIIPDHYIFTADPHARRNLDILRSFAAEQDLPHFYDFGTPRYKGVCHVALAHEGFDFPGQVLFGTDSHTCTAGAFGMFATGIGNTDAAFILGTGKLWVKVPQTLRFVFDGEIPDYVMAKDLILQIIGDIGVDGATYCAMEFAGSGIEALGMEERMTICNMAIEAGAKSGIIAPDAKTFAFLEGRAKRAFEPVYSDPDAKVARQIVYKSSDLEPVVAKPHSPDNKAKVSEVAGTKLDRSYIGSCTGGKTEDFVAAARILDGRKVAIPTFIVPATTDVAADLRTVRHNGKSLFDIFVAAGCDIGEASCAACLGGPADTFGRTHGAEQVISTTNRNFPGRMGSKQSAVYLASPLTAAASAVTGVITDPREFLK